MKKFLFIHGGPGLNSECERRVLDPLLRGAGIECTFWNAPSNLRPDGDAFWADAAFAGWLDSLERALSAEKAPVGLIGSSFGALTALHLLQRRPQDVGELVLSAPAIDLFGALTGMMRYAAQDFAKSAPEKAAKMNEFLDSTRSILDPAMQQGLALAGEDPTLFANYWANGEKLAAWDAVLAEPCFGFDAEMHGAVLVDYASGRYSLEGALPDRPVKVVYGEKDAAVDSAATTSWLRARFSTVKDWKFDQSSHFPHVEEPGKFLEVLSS